MLWKMFKISEKDFLFYNRKLLYMYFFLLPYKERINKCLIHMLWWNIYFISILLKMRINFYLNFQMKNVNVFENLFFLQWFFFRGGGGRERYFCGIIIKTTQSLYSKLIFVFLYHANPPTVSTIFTHFLFIF